MGVLKTKDAAVLISVSQATIKRWASAFPDIFQKDRLGHYIFTEHDITQLMHIKERIDQGEQLDRIQLKAGERHTASRQVGASAHALDKALPYMEDAVTEEIRTRIEQVERTLHQKADEVVSVQLLLQREELEELRQMIMLLAAAVETMQTSAGKARSPHGELQAAAAVKLQAPPKKRGLLRSIFSFL